MLIKVLILYFSLFSYVKNNEEKMCRRSTDADGSSVGSDLVKSFIKLTNKLGEFFKVTKGVPVNNFEKKRRKIKKALHNFIVEVFYDKTNSTKNKLALHRLTGPNAIHESQMSTIEMILYHGYQVEAHTVQTRDGYMLRLHRVMPSSKISTTKNSIVILHHGLMGSSDDWVLLGPNQALPYLLSDAGYDVWLTNARGSKYSRLMTTFSDKSSEFWDFSFHEMGTFDLPAIIDYIKDNSESFSEINFIGFSMGATALLVLLSSLPQYNQVLKSATLLAPLAFMYQIKGPLKLLAEFHGENAQYSLNFLGVNEFMRIETYPSEIIEKYCRGDSRLCRNPLMLIANGGKEIKNESILENVLGHLPGGGASMKTILHYVQLVNSGRFQMYDYGTLVNLKTYGERFPLRYKLENVTLPIVLFSSLNDWLSTNANIMRLLSMLPNVVVHHVIKDPDFSHTDFVWGEEAPILLFHIIIDILGSISDRINK